ncbi:orotidine-5'-phosphate decarboxylase [Brachybacterium huguangmaarense]|uniref:Orotidine-5'-phosphate decarboxylase n=1 Tax=Brachybacterium huguangmaarense TaxID=1652028 RepID=A0ABY6G1A1_9MICO|nr:orotidine-5'-phosphate decarboxylase [Brachybacterium huguangmaarense]UYG16444.1 orotidine-5'-phosphate decarboxylase [Brachybacterium huguangmaarense]
MSAPFGDRLREAVAAHGPVVAGIDPHAPLLAAWGLPDDADGVRRLGAAVLEAVDGHVAAIKPQSAFFERHGSRGVAALEDLLAEARDRGVLTILDVKRGDIGSTMGAYADAHLRPGAPLEADAITTSPYLGFGSLRPALDLAAEHGKGVFVLALTSNPDGAQVQHAREADGTAVARRIVELVEAENADAAAWGSVGLVVGATVGSAPADLGIDLVAGRAPLLAPGFGAQGAGVAERDAVFAGASGRVLVSVSRALLGAGPDVGALRRAADELAERYR